MSLDVGLVKWGNGYWKMNTSLLHDVEYIQLVKNEIKNTLNCYKVENDQNFEAYSIDFQLLFEVLKLNIRGKTISYSVNKAKQIKAKEEELGKNIQKLEDLLVKSQKLNIERISLSHIESDLQLLKKNLIKLREPKLKAMVLWSKIQYYEQG